MSATLRERLIALIEPLVGRLGYELVDLEQSSGRGSAVVRLFIDSPEGVGLTDCERVSREVSALLHVNDLLIQHAADLVILDEAQQFPLGAGKLPR